jgi:esterase/lipase superfamily enzyme
VPDLPFSGGATKMVALLQMNERYLRWYSPWLSREFEMLAFGNGCGLPLIIFPTSFGRYYQNKDFGLVGSVSAFVDAGRVTVYCPDAIDLESFYNESINPADRMRTHNAYENVIVHDVFDFARRECVAIASQFAEPVSALITRPTLPFVIPTPSVFSSV